MLKGVNSRAHVFVLLLIIGVTAIGCSASPPLPVDLTRFSSPPEVTSWRHHREFAADLNGDAKTERIVVASDVELAPDGTPLWEDGHRWAVFVSGEPDPTLLYASFVPNGHVEAAVLIPNEAGHRNVLITERSPYQTRSFVVAYEEAGDAKTVTEAIHQIQERLPDLREN